MERLYRLNLPMKEERFNVQIRVDDSFTLEMHIDTDEANASQIRTGDVGILIK